MAHAHSVKEYPGQLVGVAFASMVTGMVTAILITPKRGAEIRHSLSGRLKKLNRHNRSSNTAKQAAQDTTKNLSRTASVAKTRAKSTASKIKTDTAKTAKDAKSDVKQAAKSAKRTSTRPR